MSAEERMGYVRTLQEQVVSMLPGTIDQTKCERNRPDYSSKKIIVHCTVGYRSVFYAQELRQQRLDAYNLSEGILGWAYVGGLLFDP